MDSYYLQQILSVINDLYDVVNSISKDAHNILIGLVFFGFLFFAINFISKRWLVLSC